MIAMPGETGPGPGCLERLVQDRDAWKDWHRIRVARRPAKGGHVLLFSSLSAAQQAKLKLFKMSGFSYILYYNLYVLLLQLLLTITSYVYF